MNIINKLTFRQLKLNKRRTLVTIIGVIISVAMVMAVATLTVSFIDLLRRQTIIQGGEWHVLYKGINADQLGAIKGDRLTKDVAITRDRGYAVLKGSKNDYKPYLFIKEYDSQGFKQLPVELAEGRLPEANDEVVISEHIATNGKVEYEIGDVLELDIGNRLIEGETGESYELGQNNPFQKIHGDEKRESLRIKESRSYKIVGVIKRPTWEPISAPGYTIISYLDESLMGPSDLFNASVVFNKVNQSVYGHVEGFAGANDIGPESVTFNNELLRYSGAISDDNTRKTLYSLSAIIMIIIMVGSISLIYNAFAISVSERSRYLGMLSGIGATRKQKRNGVLFEGLVIGLVSIPTGIICGIAGMYVTFTFINTLIQGVFGIAERLRVIVTPLSILVASLVSAITILISAYIPAKRASKVSAIDAIRQSMDVRLTRKAVKTSRTVRALFGIEAEIGLKNLKRNKRRYRATVFSLIVSIILFLTVSFFTNDLRKAVRMTQARINYDIYMNANVDIDDGSIESIKSLPDIYEYSRVRKLYTYSWIEEEFVPEGLRDGGTEFRDGRYLYGIEVQALDDDSLSRFAKIAGADYEKLIDPNDLSAIVIDTITYPDEGMGKFVETKAIKARVGHKLDFINIDWEREVETDINSVKIIALTGESPMGVDPSPLGVINIVISERLMDSFVGSGENDPGFWDNLYLRSNNPIKTQEEIEKIQAVGLYIHNVYKQRQEEEQLILLMSVFIYGFITLITAISIANIFNTISTSIVLRKREFAMLKSVGMTPKSFNRMINYESIFYGIKSLLYGLPISVAVMFLIHCSMEDSFEFGFSLPWRDVVIVIVAIFVIVGSTMLYSGGKIKKENIMDGLKQEII
ncbi:MAG TPA: FtsX-like permease family protein [Clostridia bacterium]|nr:FtsX-like permease family protein [Clostridia bacterium]